MASVATHGVSHQRLHDVGLDRVGHSLHEHLCELRHLRSTNIIACMAQTVDNIAKQRVMRIDDMEYVAIVIGAGELQYCTCCLVNRRELDILYHHRVSYDTQRGISLEASHGGVGVEVSLELTILGTRREVTQTHNLGTQASGSNRLQDSTLGQELGVRIFIAQILPEVELRLVQTMWFGFGSLA